MRIRIGKLDVFIVIAATICIVFGIVMWAAFSSIYSTLVIQNLRLSENTDTSLGYSAFQYTNPQVTNVMKFYFFNLTNPDEVKYYSAAPNMVEIGPFSVIESEQKKYLDFNGDKSQMFYQNYKKYILSKDYSCDECDWDRTLVFPNPPGLGAVGSMIDPQFKITRTGRTIIATALMILGEYPFVSHKVREVLFDGYEDALLSAAHSGFVTILSGIFKGDGGSIVPIPIPQMPKFGYFQGYNNSRDEEYWIETGKDDINQIGQVKKWAGITELPGSWWTGDHARRISGSDSGSFTQMHLDESSTADMFFSFMCRSFTKTFYKKDTIQSIPTMGYHIGYDEWDTTSDKNIGFRYRNIEKRNYFPDWPKCPPKGECHQAGSIECWKSENFCHACCDGSFYNGTYFLPPGMFPLVCYPGRLQPTPFAVVYSPPHFLFSPDEVRNPVVGMKPDPVKHEPMIYYHETYSGTTLKVVNRLQVNMPVIKSLDVPSSQNMPNVMIPLFWQEATPIYHQFIFNQVWLGFVLVPRLMTVLQFVALGFGLFLLALLFFLQLRKSKSSSVKPMKSSFLERTSNWLSSTTSNSYNSDQSGGLRRM
ncbi:hypothetical protein L5515_001275 [Caenorhabditis briggsae]|uniref:Uncharacterized protein n=2 Tax=Caenorhabditis briggsae TaxID=6238 RepID=A0AAE9E454_CAEBR|nr:hypothetical protein L5515_001275 [Caenorhabditis briggsae]